MYLYRRDVHYDSLFVRNTSAVVSDSQTMSMVKKKESSKSILNWGASKELESHRVNL